MQGPIAQSMGLVLAANAVRRGMSVSSWPDASIYTFCNRVDFVESPRHGPPVPRPNRHFPDPQAWLGYVQRETDGAKLRVLPRSDPNFPDRRSVGLVGGGPIVLVETQGAERGAWASEWSVTNQAAPDQRIWSVTYRQYAPPPAPEHIWSTVEMKAEVADAISGAQSFAAGHKMGFEDYLAKGRTALDSAHPLENFYHADVVPTELIDLENQQLLAACAGAWVFGGMGSWNDVWFEGPEMDEYNRVSDRLFNAIMNGVVTATNSSH